MNRLLVIVGVSPGAFTQLMLHWLLFELLYLYLFLHQGRLRVNRLPVVVGISPGAFTQLTLHEPLFVGGCQDFGRVSKFAGSHSSFRGCVQRVIINGVELDLVHDPGTKAI